MTARKRNALYGIVIVSFLAIFSSLSVVLAINIAASSVINEFNNSEIVYENGGTKSFKNFKEKIATKFNS